MTSMASLARLARVRAGSAAAARALRADHVMPQAGLWKYAYDSGLRYDTTAQKTAHATRNEPESR